MNFKAVLFFGLFILNISCNNRQEPSSFSDKTHFSEVFGKEKGYRIYLPKGYEKTKVKYPVIYYLHGWGGRHFKSGGAKFEFEMIGDLVDKYQIILVMGDGNMEESEPRPYNIGYHDHMVFQSQMKDYFLELVDHIDTTYKTRNNRGYRGLIGHSMGGFMAYYLAGKYPDKISAAVNSMGSTEFFIGYPDNYTLFPVRYAFSNLKDVQIRLHNSTIGELSDLNKETHKAVLWETGLKYEYEAFEGGHAMDKPGRPYIFEKAMQFVIYAFENPIPKKEKWSHYDLYDSFKVWGYSVESNKKQPGYLFIKDVSDLGFGFYTKEWLPNGPPLNNCLVTITTANSYKPNTDYYIKDYNQKKKTLLKSIQKSDAEGRLRINSNSDGHEIGIYEKNGKPKLTFIDYTINENKKILRIGSKNNLTLKVLNLGGIAKNTEKVRVNLSSNNKETIFEPSTLQGHINKDGKLVIPPVVVLCAKRPPLDATPPELKIKLSLVYGDLTFEEDFIVPVFFDVPVFSSLTIDDGLSVQDTIVGVGNGDGMVSPGEEIMIYTQGHRTQLYYDDPYIIGERLFDETLPAKWDEDGITLSSIIKISKNCPNGHQLNLLAKYETKTHMPIKRSVHWGEIIIQVVKTKGE
ncbi:MAG: alpha/beta fold hydrolase [Flavobacteriaceae bacterium]